MRRIAIIDHNEHDLIIEDINEEVLEKEYGNKAVKKAENTAAVATAVLMPARTEYRILPLVITGASGSITRNWRQGRSTGPVCW